jgi:tRNA(Ile)-lysidine synthase
MVEKVFPGAAENLLDNIARFNDIEVLYQQSVELHKKKLLEKKGSEWHIPVLKLKQSSPLPTLLWEITREFGFLPGQIPDIVSLLDGQSGKLVRSSSHRIIRNRKWLIIAPLVAGEDNPVYFEEGMDEISFGHQQLQMIRTQAGTHPISTNSSIATLDTKHIRFPLIVRKWKAGDYFYPLGMKKKKKLSRFFIDQKLSRTQKEQVWVIESDKKICWVIGLRIDDRFKITPGTKTIMELRLISD